MRAKHAHQRPSPQGRRSRSAPHSRDPEDVWRGSYPNCRHGHWSMSPFMFHDVDDLTTHPFSHHLHKPRQVLFVQRIWNPIEPAFFLGVTNGQEQDNQPSSLLAAIKPLFNRLCPTPPPPLTPNSPHNTHHHHYHHHHGRRHPSPGQARPQRPPGHAPHRHAQRSQMALPPRHPSLPRRHHPPRPRPPRPRLRLALPSPPPPLPQPPRHRPRHARLRRHRRPGGPR